MQFGLAFHLRFRGVGGRAQERFERARGSAWRKECQRRSGFLLSPCFLFPFLCVSLPVPLSLCFQPFINLASFPPL